MTIGKSVFGILTTGRVSTEAIRSRIKRIALHAGIDPSRVEQITPHSTRIYFATSSIDTGTDISVVKKLLGHSNIETTMLYVQARRKTMDEAIENNDRVMV